MNTRLWDGSTAGPASLEPLFPKALCRSCRGPIGQLPRPRVDSIRDERVTCKCPFWSIAAEALLHPHMSAFHPLQPPPDLPIKINARATCLQSDGSMLPHSLSEALKRAVSTPASSTGHCNSRRDTRIHCEVGPAKAPVRNDAQTLIISRRFSTMRRVGRASERP